MKIKEPCICAMRGRNPDNPSDRTVGIPTEQRIEIGSEQTSNALTTVQKDNLVIEPKEPIAYDEQYIDCPVNPISKKLEFDGYKDTECPTLLATDYKCPKTVAFKDEPNYRIRKLTERECFRLMGVKGEDFEKVRYGETLPKGSHKKIVERVMTKAEWKACWRIMRHDRQSMSSCYHLVGDSIVTACLMAIFGQMFDIDYEQKITELIEELKTGG